MKYNVGDIITNGRYNYIVIKSNDTCVLELKTDNEGGYVHKGNYINSLFTLVKNGEIENWRDEL